MTKPFFKQSVRKKAMAMMEELSAHLIELKKEVPDMERQEAAIAYLVQTVATLSCEIEQLKLQTK
jgi:hypothetical protein